MLGSLPGYEEYPRDGITGTQLEELLDVRPGQVFHGHVMSSERLFQTLSELDFAIVFVYRDLRDVIISNYFHLAKLNPMRAPEQFWTMDMEELLRPDNLPDWCVPVKRYPDIRSWLSRDDVVAVRYEDLKRDTAGELSKVLQHFGLDVTQDLVQQIVQKQSFESLSGRGVGQEDPTSPYRKGIVGDWRNYFSNENIAAFKRRYGDLLIEFGYENDLNW